MQAAHRVDLGTHYQFLCVLQIILSHVLLILTDQCRDRNDLDLDPRIFILHFTGLRLKIPLPIVSTVVFHYFLLLLYYY